MRFLVKQAELIAWAKAYDGPRFHAVLSDPPYGFEFMGEEWDAPHKRLPTKSQVHTNLPPGMKLNSGDMPAYQLWTTKWASALLPLLQPGALIFAFGGTRTFGRVQCGFEDAGFKTLDCLCWLYGSGFPKAQQIKGVTLGYKTPALKPAWEPILVFLAPRQGKTYTELVLEYGSGALNVDGGRVAYQVGENPTVGGRETYRPAGYGYKPEPKEVEMKGRFPANLALECLCDELDGMKHASPDCPAYQLDEQTTLGDRGGPSRFYYCAKASRSEREAGCENLPEMLGGTLDGGHIVSDGRSAPKTGRVVVKNNHPTVKPVSLTRWLATLLLPPDSVKPRRLLVPFAGSGSEMIGALQAGWDEIVGVEQDAHYASIAQARLDGHTTKDAADG